MSDAFFAQACFRVRTWLRSKRVPILPRLLHHVAVASTRVCIGDPVAVGPGLYVRHGQVVVDGITCGGADRVLYPFVTLGLVSGQWDGPTLGRGVRVGTGKRVLGPVRVGDRAWVGANAVVLHDVPTGATAVGVPSRVVG